MAVARGIHRNRLSGLMLGLALLGGAGLALPALADHGGLHRSPPGGGGGTPVNQCMSVSPASSNVGVRMTYRNACGRAVYVVTCVRNGNGQRVVQSGVIRPSDGSFQGRMNNIDFRLPTRSGWRAMHSYSTSRRPPTRCP